MFIIGSFPICIDAIGKNVRLATDAFSIESLDRRKIDRKVTRLPVGHRRKIPLTSISLRYYHIFT